MKDVEEKVVELSEQYLGFAARSYLNRQARLHLDKPLSDITEDDLEELAQWVSNTAPLIMDAEEGKELAEEIRDLDTPTAST